MLDLHVHLIGHRERKANRAVLQSYLEAARRQGIRTIGFTDHDMYWDELDLPMIRESALSSADQEVLVGLEVDYRPDDAGRIAERLKQFKFDYVIGSVHEIHGWPFDMEDQEGSCRAQDADALYRRYFALIAQAARSGLFQIIGHLDLIKLFGIRPNADILALAAEALDAIQDQGLAVEINTNGRYKPVGEFYPEGKLVQEIQRRGIHFTLGSDAHQAENVGRDLAEALEILRAAGVGEIVSFKSGRKIYHRI
ncbi:MAG: histidinol-phosphatase HisJ family protein [Peptococcaceae bacterium]|nr:histidinol-phosphatase HisJ family protein [Peptococcaceae bacterium]